MLIFCRSQSTPARLAATAGDADADDLNEPLLGRERSAPHRDTSCSAAGTSSAGTVAGRRRLGERQRRQRGARPAQREQDRLGGALVRALLKRMGCVKHATCEGTAGLQATSGRHAGDAALVLLRCSTPFPDRGCPRAATLAGCLAPFLPASLRPFRLNALEARRSVAHCCGQ